MPDSAVQNQLALGLCGQRQHMALPRIALATQHLLVGQLHSLGPLVLLHTQPRVCGLRGLRNKCVPGLHQALAKALWPPIHAALFDLRRGKE